LRTHAVAAAGCSSSCSDAMRQAAKRVPGAGSNAETMLYSALPTRQAGMAAQAGCVKRAAVAKWRRQASASMRRKSPVPCSGGFYGGIGVCERKLCEASQNPESLFGARKRVLSSEMVWRGERNGRRSRW